MTKTWPITLSQLLESLPRAPGDNGRELVRKAYAFAAAAHEGQRRASRELFVEHDLAVAHIVSQLQVDAPTVAAALLHDVLLPHTQLDEAAVRKAFGAEVGSLVAALAKLAPYSEGLSTASREQTTEAVRRALLTIIEGDARVILIRLADRLQDLRKAGDLPREERESLALEAREIQAPLANRLGIWQLKWELEDMSFRWLEPEQYRKIASYVAERREERDRWIQRAIQALKRRLNEAGIQSELTGRPKHMYSIYRKMQEKGLNFEQIYDLRALRVIIESDDPSLCYQALGIVHQLWTPEAKAFDDYIAKPKGNGYRSLHTAVLDEQGQYLEVQIRTRAMHS
ncbi:MAG: HD domain-containing protein, partial [Candidatus Promineifilaceae bacterium]